MLGSVCFYRDVNVMIKANVLSTEFWLMHRLPAQVVTDRGRCEERPSWWARLLVCMIVTSHLGLITSSCFGIGLDCRLQMSSYRTLRR